MERHTFDEYVAKGDIVGRLDVIPNGLVPKTRRFVVLGGLGPRHPLAVYNNNIRTTERAFLERSFMVCVDGKFVPPLAVASDEYKSPGLCRFRAGIKRFCSRMSVSSARIVVSSYIDARKRKRYMKALDSLLITKLTIKDAKLGSFVKFEKQDSDKPPRIINPRSYRFNLVLGKFLKLNEKQFYRAINHMFGARTTHTVLKGLNARQTAAVIKKKWDQFVDPIAIGLDATKFDMHVSEEALEYEHSIYNAIFNSADLAELLSWQLKNQGIAFCLDGIVKFLMYGKRCSGDLNTSLGNCIIMCANIYDYCLSLGIRVELCNNGDDCVVIMERVDESRFIKDLGLFFERRGFRMKVEPTVNQVEQIEFCQTFPLYINGVWKMVRNPVACLKKDPMCLIPVQSAVVLRKWMYAVGRCNLSLHSGVPILQSFAQFFLRNGIECSEAQMHDIYKTTSMFSRIDQFYGATEVSDASRVEFWRAFGILPDVQREFENYYDSLKFKDSVVLAGGERESAEKLSNGYNPVFMDYYFGCAR